jgi:hypothetical protein
LLSALPLPLLLPMPLLDGGIRRRRRTSAPRHNSGFLRDGDIVLAVAF